MVGLVVVKYFFALSVIICAFALAPKPHALMHQGRHNQETPRYYYYIALRTGLVGQNSDYWDIFFTRLAPGKTPGTTRAATKPPRVMHIGRLIEVRRAYAFVRKFSRA